MAYKYLIFNKPFEVLSQFSDARGRSTLQDYIQLPGVYSAGRLDYRSEGLLLLTDDGDLIHRLTDPRFDHPKTYLAQVEGVLTPEHLSEHAEGVFFTAIQSKPAQVMIVPEPSLFPRRVPVRNYHPTTWVEIVLREGKKHEARRLTAALGFPTLRLVRVAIGRLELGDLKPGEWRFLTRSEIERDILG